MPNNPLVVCDDGGASDDDSLCSLAGKCDDDFLMIMAVADVVVCDDGGASDDDSLCSLVGKSGDDFLMIRVVVDVVGCDDGGASDETGLRSLRRLIGVQVFKFITSCFLQVSLLCLRGASSL
ncbi:hypothetical protein DPMN_012677 [Dreissena polymorpha]|uniref:Uncharacterized protein n=1 Tax=Dreissena polymorpha TaxID=45954 RepID=A0A9D4N2V3_DREPO|nr:hypothetical protein DPMN_012677 [Dreissena polymorpha]